MSASARREANSLRDSAIPRGAVTFVRNLRELRQRKSSVVLAFSAAFLVLFVLAPRPVRAADVQSVAQAGAVSVQQQALQASGVAPKRGVSFEVSSGSNTIFLFGTIHAGKAEFYPLNVAVARALANASRVVFELDFTDPATAEKVLQAGTYPAGITLDRTLPPALMRRVESAMSRYGVAGDEIKRKKPWAVALELLSLEGEKLGYSSMFASDLYLAAMAKVLEKPISGLESAEEQVAVFERMSDEEQRAILEDTLAALDDGRAKAELESAVNAWASADRVALAASVAKTRSDAPPALQSLQLRMLDQRNTVMAQRIETIVRSGETAFVAVGAAHLVGPGSVVELLRKRGLTVREL
jgi:uncharacterized protein YbaP (TraB family)